MKAKLLTLASAAAMFAACSDTSVSDGNDQIKDVADVVFLVRDVLTREPMENVSVYSRLFDKTKETDSAGTITWENVEIGHINFDVQYDGYAFKRIIVDVNDDTKNDVARVLDVHKDVDMYEIGVGIKGQFFYEDVETKNKIPAAGVTIYATYADDEIYPKEIYTTTDSNGFYEFKDMASNIGISLSSERFTLAKDSSKVYEAVGGFASVNERKGVLKEVDPAYATIASLDPILLSSNLDKIETKTNLELTFSEALEKDSVKTLYVCVKNATGDDDCSNNASLIATNLSLSADGKTITVKPASGSWVNYKNYKVVAAAWSKNAKAAKLDKNDDSKKSLDFTVGAVAVPGQVKNLAVKLDADKKEMIGYSFENDYTYNALNLVKEKKAFGYSETITITWDEIEEGVDSYNVYIKGDAKNDADYKLVGNISADDFKVAEKAFPVNVGDEFSATNVLDYPLSDKQSKVVNIIVLPVNDKSGEALASEAKPLSVNIGDKVKAKISEKQTNDYIENADVEIAALNACTADNGGCTLIAKGDDAGFTAGGDYFNVTLNITMKVQKDYDAKKMPAGYDLYYNDGKAWKFVRSVTGIAPTTISPADDVSPFKDKNMKYKKDEVVNVKFAVVPFFMEGTSKISATDLASTKGVFTAKDDVVEMVKAYLK